MKTFCRMCGTESDHGARFCHTCGASIPTLKPMPASGQIARPSSAAPYAGFWKRFAASLIDSIIISAFTAILLGMHIILKEVRIIDGDAEEVSLALIVISPVILTWLYSSLMECSPMQGTLGKMALGIAVTDPYGNRISFGRATGRHFSKLLSSMFFGAGYFLAAFTDKKQALHDLMTHCLVVNNRAG